MVKIVEYFMKNVPNENIINITPTKSISLLEIANIVNNFANNKVEITIKNPVLNNEYTGDNSLLLKNYPTLTFTSIEDGLKKLYRYNSEMSKERI